MVGLNEWGRLVVVAIGKGGRVLERERRQGNNDVRIAKQFGDGRNEVGLNELILDETSGEGTRECEKKEVY